MLRNIYGNSKEKIDENKYRYGKEEYMNSNYLFEFFSIYWRYRYCSIDSRIINLFNKIATDNNYIIELNQKALLGIPPSVCILQDYKNEFEEIYVNNNKYFCNPLIGAFAGYLVKYHPASQHLQNNKIEQSNLNNINHPQKVMTFKR